jgi:aminopeptidase YwaD
MMMKTCAFLLFLALSSPVVSAGHVVPKKTFDLIANEYSGEATEEDIQEIVQYSRIQGSPMMLAVAQGVVLAKLKAWGIESSLEQYPSDGKTRYQTIISPMGWDMRGGELWVQSTSSDPGFAPLRLCRYSDVPMCVSTHSKGGEWSGELVDVGSGTSDADYEGKDMRGKVALAYGYAGNVVREAGLKHGAVGVVIYPGPDDRPDHPDMIRYNGIWPRVEELDKTVGGFQISGNQYAYLHRLMSRGAVRVRGMIDATLGPGQLTMVHAWIRGTKSPEVEVIVSAHLDHPKWSANDNASGSAAMLEMARTLHSLITSGQLAAPQITIHFMWVPEYYGTTAYVTEHSDVHSCNAEGWDDPRERSAVRTGSCVVANLNLDMVGEDTVKTNSRFYITRTPDSVDGFLNGVLADVLAQTREADIYAPTGTRNYWPTEMRPYAQGSDHDVFLGLGIPSAMFGHAGDWTHHTSEDKLDKTDPTELLRVGVLTTAAAYLISGNSGRDNTEWLGAESLAATDVIADRARRVSEILAGSNSPNSRKRLETHLETAEEMVRQQRRYVRELASKGGELSSQKDSVLKHKSGTTPRRLMLLPIESSVFESLSAEDKRWWNNEKEHFASPPPGGGVTATPTFAVIVFETINFMDGKRTTQDIADLLSAEYNYDFDYLWVNHVVEILAKLGLVSTR